MVRIPTNRPPTHPGKMLLTGFFQTPRTKMVNSLMSNADKPSLGIRDFGKKML
jgi:hypothetical protein